MGADFGEIVARGRRTWCEGGDRTRVLAVPAERKSAIIDAIRRVRDVRAIDLAGA